MKPLPGEMGQLLLAEKFAFFFFFSKNVSLENTSAFFIQKENKPMLLIMQVKKKIKKIIYTFESWIILAKHGEQNLNRIHGHWKGFRGFGRVC